MFLMGSVAMRLVLFFSVLLACAFAEERESRLVHTSQGPVRGYKDIEDDVFAFHGIPYATAPTGSNRFKAPLPPPKWVEPLEAEDKGVICPQSDPMGVISKTKIIQEDCLIANIYVPAKQENKVPVVVYVHGGAYVLGYGNMMTPNKLVNSQKVIVVTFNYRLGAHGFLCLGTADAPGNAGMKDQVGLLRWVRKNIASFGGDPDEVTIAGYSAGSSSVDLLMISKMAKGLFKRVIPESGANTAAFSIQSDPIENAKEYAKLLNYTSAKDVYDLEDFYKSLSLEKLTEGNVMSRPDSIFVMSPCLERETKEENFLIESPVNILKSGDYEKLPILYGFANMEGLLRISLFDTWKDQMNEKFSEFLPADLHFESKKEREEVANEIKRFYFGNEPVGQENVLAYVDYFSDVFFAYPTLRSTKFHVEAGNDQVYLYEFSYVDENTPLVPYTNVKGAFHCAQTMTVLDKSAIFGPVNIVVEESLQLTDIVREIWLNFATTGKPVLEDSKLPEWPSVGVDWSPHMSINKTLELKGSLLKERTLFWEKIYAKYYRQPVPPPAPPKKREEL